MNHLIISREYPPAPYAGGGIGTYVEHISRLLAEHGETVHVIAQLCPGAPRRTRVYFGGRLTVHRVALDEPLDLATIKPAEHQAILDAFRDSVLPCQAFLWQAAMLAEWLIENAGIDIVEAQEYEAPLYFLMLRRAMGLGPSRRVPLLVHLHSPTEFIFAENECQERPDYVPLKRLEDYTIRAADALVCPSAFLARMAESHYRLEPASIEVIPYPKGTSGVIARDDATWRDGSISYVGRLEPRKGVQEWVEAAIAVAMQDSSPRFTFVGADSVHTGMGDRSMLGMLRSGIPAALQSRFLFYEAIPRNRLVAHRRQARIAVVPSRWENFPYACIEAMASGLPVIVSARGGTAEMVTDGQTGWIVARPDAQSLEAALRRALATSPSGLADMGTAAAASIEHLCGSERIVGRQMTFRHRVVARGCRRSSEVPCLEPARVDNPLADDGAAPHSPTPSGVLIVVRSKRHEPSTACMRSIATQTVAPADVLVVSPRNSNAFDSDPTAVLSASNPLAVALVDDDWTLAPDYVATVNSTFTRCAILGILAPWRLENGRLQYGPPPAFPYQLVSNDVGPCAAFRAVAIDDVEARRLVLGAENPLWELSNTVLARGWRAAPFPAALASGHTTFRPLLLQRRRIAERSFQGDRTMTPFDLVRATPRQRLAVLRRAVANPSYVVRWFAWHGWRTLSGVPRRLLAATRSATNRRA